MENSVDYPGVPQVVLKQEKLKRQPGDPRRLTKFKLDFYFQND